MVAIGNMGPAARDAIPRLARILKKGEGDGTKAAAARALGRIGTNALPTLVEALSDAQQEVRDAAAFMICSRRRIDPAQISHRSRAGSP